MLQWLDNNKEWLFSGVGISVFVFILSRLLSPANRATAATLRSKNRTTIKSARSVFIGNTPHFESFGNAGSAATPVEKRQHRRHGNVNPNHSLISGLALSNESKQMDKDKGTRFVESDLPQMIQLMSKAERKLKSILFLDIDNLTIINKHFGIDVGDLVLAVVGGFGWARKAIKYFGRCGDDTFYGVFLKADYVKTSRVAEKLRRDIDEFSWNIVAPGLHVTCTIGYSLLDERENPHEWIKRAIHGMLEGKRKGGNVVEHPPIFSGRRKVPPKQPPREPENLEELSLRRFFS